MVKQLHNAYEEAIRKNRDDFANHPAIIAAFSKSTSRDFAELFLIYWTVLSAGLTQPIPRYLKSAGEKCQEKKLPELAHFFFEHYKEEDGHDGWAMADTTKLVARWNQRHPDSQLNAEALLELKLSPGVKKYHELHEHFIFGDAPYGELAIDMEIELITVKYGPRMILQGIWKVGPSLLFDMSFLREHVRFDFGHTDKNFMVLDQLLKSRPEFLNPLLEAGRGALETYGGFLNDALSYAKDKSLQLTLN